MKALIKLDNFKQQIEKYQLKKEYYNISEALKITIPIIINELSLTKKLDNELKKSIIKQLKIMLNTLYKISFSNEENYIKNIRIIHVLTLFYDICNYKYKKNKILVRL